MKIYPSRKQQGSVLMVALVTAGVIGLTLAAYLEVIKAQHQSVYRSMNWNSVLPVCEAGVEEGMTQLNAVGKGDRGSNGWTMVNNQYYMARTIGDGRYEVYITTNDPAIITCSGYVKAPLQNREICRNVVVHTTRTSTGTKGFVAKNNISLGPGSVVDSFDSRYTPVYSSSVARSNAFAGAVDGSIDGGVIQGDAGTGPEGLVTSTVTGSIRKDLNLSFPDVATPFAGGYNLSDYANATVHTTNYFTSTNTYSTNVFPSPAPGGTYATNKTVVFSPYPPAPGVPYASVVTNCNTTLWPGSLYTVTTNTASITNVTSQPAPGTYLIPPGLAYSTNYVTNLVFSTNNGGHVSSNLTSTSSVRYGYTQITGYTYYGTNYIITNSTYLISATITNQTVYDGNYTYALTASGNYVSDTSVSMSGNSEMIVTGNAVLWLKQGIQMTGKAQITVVPGASLTIYIGNTSGSAVDSKFAGNGVVNMAGDTSKMNIYGMPNNTTITVAGNGSFVGSIYAPQATLYGKGGGNDTDDMQGAVVVNFIVYVGHFHFHYDEKLGANSAVTQWNVSSWQEY